MRSRNTALIVETQNHQEQAPSPRTSLSGTLSPWQDEGLAVQLNVTGSQARQSQRDKSLLKGQTGQWEKGRPSLCSITGDLGGPCGVREEVTQVRWQLNSKSQQPLSVATFGNPRHCFSACPGLPWDFFPHLASAGQELNTSTSQTSSSSSSSS